MSETIQALKNMLEVLKQNGVIVQGEYEWKLTVQAQKWLWREE